MMVLAFIQTRTQIAETGTKSKKKSGFVCKKLSQEWTGLGRQLIYLVRHDIAVGRTRAEKASIGSCQI